MQVKLLKPEFLIKIAKIDVKRKISVKFNDDSQKHVKLFHEIHFISFIHYFISSAFPLISHSIPYYKTNIN